MTNKKLLLVFAVFLSFQMTGFSGSEDWALSVDILPEAPTIHDSIDIISSAIAGSGPVAVENTLFQYDGTNLTLDLYLNVGMFTVMTPWSYTETIGTLPAGTYDLTVTAYYDYSGFIDSEDYFTSFEVVIPEPASLLLLAFGGVLIRRR